ncbi:substrate-binding periplasmic protein [Desulfovibrio oxyclinae]|uniref:substrate-binding periplasmic protein n=1 Tax=Desulfovibrio oxyclinae TaxID=63560 RepID=UPI00037493C3|nr:ABC transporter substrate-binding protein [Desulfovibrio oxyclinae]
MMLRSVVLTMLVLGLTAFARPAFSLTIITEHGIPAAFYDEEGELTGLCVEAVRDIQRRIGDETPIRVLPWARGYDIAQTTSEVLLFPTTRTSARERLFHWVGPMLRITWVLYGMEGRFDLETLDDARNLRRIGGIRGDAKMEFLKSKGFDNLQEVSSGKINIDKLRHGRLDAFFTSNVGMFGAAEVSGVSTEGIVPLLTVREVDLYLAFSKETSEKLVEKWRRAHLEQRRDGTFKRLYEKWLPGESVPELPGASQ